MERQPPAHLGDAGFGVHGLDLSERLPEFPLEVLGIEIFLAKLLPQIVPADPHAAGRCDPAQTVRQPSVDVQRQRRLLERGQGAVIQGHRVAEERVVEVARKLDGSWPCSRVGGSPRLESPDRLRVHGDAGAVPVHAQRQAACGKRLELLAQGGVAAPRSAVGLHSKHPKKLPHARSRIDHPRPRSNGLSGQVDHDQPRDAAVRKAAVHKLDTVEDPARLQKNACVSAATLECARVRATPRESGLAQDRVQKVRPLRRECADLGIRGHDLRPPAWPDFMCRPVSCVCPRHEAPSAAASAVEPLREDSCGVLTPPARPGTSGIQTESS